MLESFFRPQTFSKQITKLIEGDAARRRSMNTSDYRREYRAYQAALERERYQLHASLESPLHLEPLHDRYADLHTSAAINDLQRAWSETNIHLETERAGLRTLLSAARLWHGEAQATQITEELNRCEAASEIDWKGERVAVRDGLARIANEPEGVRRRDLAARWSDAVSRCDDLRLARLESLRDSARALGLPNRRALYEEATNADHEELAVGAANFLTRTAPAYLTHLSQWAARHLPADLQRDPTHADFLFLARAAHLDKFLSASGLLPLYTAAMNDLGIFAERQTNVHIDNAPPGSEVTHTQCYVINPPNDVRLLIVRADGIEQCVTLLREAGRTQHFGWVSPDLAARHPEFVYAFDKATPAGFACLFSSLCRDAAWIGEHRGLGEREATRIARTLALIEAHNVRRSAALLRVELDTDNAERATSEDYASLYATRLHETTGFRPHPGMYLIDITGDFSSGVSLRARLFAARLGEHLRTEHGRRWWATRGARDELIDMWNTGSRYSVEDLARLACGGPLDFDLLAETTTGSLNGE